MAAENEAFAITGINYTLQTSYILKMVVVVYIEKNKNKKNHKPLEYN